MFPPTGSFLFDREFPLLAEFLSFFNLKIVNSHLSLHQRLDLLYIKFDKDEIVLKCNRRGAGSRGGQISEARDATRQFHQSVVKYIYLE